MRVDVHQHIWTEALIERLADRRDQPFIRREDGLTVLHCVAEQPYVIDVESELPDSRAQCVRNDALDLALVAISTPIGIEALPREAAAGLIDAHLDGVLGLPEEFAAWGPVPLDEPDPDDIDYVLGRGCVGISLPAGALAGPERLGIAGPLLDRAAQRGVPVFVHPGRAPGQPHTPAAFGEPLWWRPLTDYVDQMQAAWLTFATLGRREHPELKILFAMLAGGAPLMSERLASRGAPSVELDDPGIFYECSSYGPAAVEMMARRVGPAALVYGSDRPVVTPVPTGQDALLQGNAANLLPAVVTA